MGNIGPRSWQYGPSAARSVQKRPRANIPQYGSSKLHGTRVMLVLKLPAFENKKYTSYDHFHGNSPYGKIPTKKEPIRTPGFTPRLPCHIIIMNTSQNASFDKGGGGGGGGGGRGEGRAVQCSYFHLLTSVCYNNNFKRS